MAKVAVCSAGGKARVLAAPPGRAASRWRSVSLWERLTASLGRLLSCRRTASDSNVLLECSNNKSHHPALVFAGECDFIPGTGRIRTSAQSCVSAGDRPPAGGACVCGRDKLRPPPPGTDLLRKSAVEERPRQQRQPCGAGRAEACAGRGRAEATRGEFFLQKTEKAAPFEKARGGKKQKAGPCAKPLRRTALLLLSILWKIRGGPAFSAAGTTNDTSPAAMRRT